MTGAAYCPSLARWVEERGSLQGVHREPHFDEIQIGDSASLVRTLSQGDIDLFAVMSGDVNPAHVDQEYARSDMFHRIVAHGMWGGMLISALLGTKLPGPGAVYISQDLRFRRPVGLGDTISVAVTAMDVPTYSRPLFITDAGLNISRTFWTGATSCWDRAGGARADRADQPSRQSPGPR